MEGAPPGITEYLLSLGLPGLVIAALAVALKRIFELYVETNNKRLEEAGNYKVALLDATNQLKTMTAILEAMGKGER